MGEVQERTIYLSGLPWEATEDELAEWLVANANVAKESIESLKIPTWYDSGRNRGYALVQFTDVESAKQALTADRKSMRQRYLEIRPSRGPKLRRAPMKSGDVPDDCKVLFVKNLPYETDEEEVKNAFQRFGEVVGVRLGRWNNTGRLKGFGYVEFSQPSMVKSVLACTEDIYVGNRVATCDFETNGRPRNSFRDTRNMPWKKQHGRQFKKEPAATVNENQSNSDNVTPNNTNETPETAPAENTAEATD